ncbi:flagellar hook-basal body complex protein FliE [Schlesneria paludicola]|uniref:flagellar hook-basal body complex protein FliE n=1 Tax=Schlesneria paludicola TaxID=360056 RepID=UPI00029B4A8F|nr:flagellar hook-basal body complex protein FliE [Schlesneria paludicola]
MNVLPAGGAASLPLGLTSVGASSNNATGTFGKVIQRFVDDTNTQQLNADIQVERLATGQSDSIHETMLALTKADLSMRVFMEVRNKVIDAYQEVMRMQL